MKQAITIAIAIIIAALICSATYAHINRYQKVGIIAQRPIYRDMISRKLIIAGDVSRIMAINSATSDIAMWDMEAVREYTKRKLN